MENQNTGKTLQTETTRLLNEMDLESQAYKPPIGFGFVKPWLTKTVWLFKAFNQRLNALEKE
ncbi:TPA: hypothetical protein NGR75_004224 [Vibrio parahaemolyticus]|nr:hypothetical protein [Vibrio parahaemolyticus]EJG1289535.1 hypothetical protein [Vibrio parahaemolyticus]EJG1299334.1 hypothetical protein [Vibrio parahaemolyticus]EJG1332037.1 hypothetical protein [Vibrio parahaemolyticus]MCF9344576.1 hypothetical protein [Vibrio parahaemolyticus]